MSLGEIVRPVRPASHRPRRRRLIAGLVVVALVVAAVGSWLWGARHPGLQRGSFSLFQDGRPLTTTQSVRNDGHLAITLSVPPELADDDLVSVGFVPLEEGFGASRPETPAVATYRLQPDQEVGVRVEFAPKCRPQTGGIGVRVSTVTLRAHLLTLDTDRQIGLRSPISATC